MLLGHRYLTNPHLPMSHLNLLAWVFLVAVLLQGGLTVAAFWFGVSTEVVFAALRLESVLGLFLWIRLAVGIVGPLVLAVMILNTIRYQANMSATGLLYIAAIMVMAGEAFSRYLLLAESILL
jgi:protein NrfD